MILQWASLLADDSLVKYFSCCACQMWPGFKLEKAPMDEPQSKSPEDVRACYERVLKRGASGPVSETLHALRRLVWVYGIPSETEVCGASVLAERTKEALKTKRTLRSKLWKVFLTVRDLDPDTYERLVRKGLCQCAEVSEVFLRIYL